MSRWPPPLERFWSYVDKTAGPDACWPWGGPRDSNNYGQLYWEGRLVLAPRLMLRLQGHVFQPGECALHHCDNPPCVNPAHLFVGTHKDNSDDMIAKGRDIRPRGDASGSRKHPERRPRGERHSHAKLSEQDVAEILTSTETGAALARRYGVNRGTVNRIRRGLTWSHWQFVEQPRRKRRLFPEEAAFIRSSAVPAPTVAQQYGVSIALVYRIRSGMAWRQSQ